MCLSFNEIQKYLNNIVEPILIRNWESYCLDEYLNDCNKTLITNIIRKSMLDVEIRKRITFSNMLSLIENLYSNKEIKIKNQYQTKCSNGAYIPYSRLKIENAMFGYSSNNFECDGIQDYPIYGFVENINKSSFYNEALLNFGTIDIVFDEKLKERTTITFCDSLKSFLSFYFSRKKMSSEYNSYVSLPQKFENANYLVMYPQIYNHITKNKLYPESIASFSKIKSDDKSGNYIIPYIECQIHGGVTLYDIKEIVIYKDNDYNIINKKSLDYLLSRLNESSFNLKIFTL